MITGANIRDIKKVKLGANAEREEEEVEEASTRNSLLRFVLDREMRGVAGATAAAVRCLAGQHFRRLSK